MTVNDLRVLRGLELLPGEEGGEILAEVPMDVPPEWEEGMLYLEADLEGPYHRYCLRVNNERYGIIVSPGQPQDVETRQVHRQLFGACLEKWGTGNLTRTDRNVYHWSSGPAPRVPGVAARALFVETDADAPHVVDAKESMS